MHFFHIFELLFCNFCLFIVSKIAATIEASKYVPYLRGDESIEIYATAVVPNKHVAMETLRVLLIRPEIKMVAVNAGPVTSGTPFKVQVTLENPLDIPLKNCKAYFGGAILQKAINDFEIG